MPVVPQEGQQFIEAHGVQRGPCLGTLSRSSDPRLRKLVEAP
jgi:hypothetical protein